MRNFFGMFTNDDDTANKNDTVNNTDAFDTNIADDREAVEKGTLQLRQEELDVNKSRVQSGEVTLSKDVIEEQKSVDVPVSREEVVIERRSLNNEISDTPITSGETIRIPVSREEVNVDKRTVLTGEVSAHKKEVEETRHIEETLKREEAHVDTTGDTNVITNK